MSCPFLTQLFSNTGKKFFGIPYSKCLTVLPCFILYFSNKINLNGREVFWNNLMTAFHYKSVQGQMWSEILALLAFILELSFVILYNIFSTSPGSGTFIFKGKKSSKVILKQELNQQSTYFALK